MTNEIQTQKIDQLGRVCIPKEVMENVHCGSGATFEVEIRNGKIALFKAKKDSFNIKRAVDELNRIVLPIDVRKTLSYEEGDCVEFRVEEVIFISKGE
ncbi:MAG: AbrB/MazE/SpoVT family DNA-binding domain-containing protein [Defluviitaleaceae bacterium]|nr:AbrB/MazE/SpoVT family DNA-binding domain-containing protein [Defluviitaleaceae bacterium]